MYIQATLSELGRAYVRMCACVSIHVCEQLNLKKEEVMNLRGRKRGEYIGEWRQ